MLIETWGYPDGFTKRDESIVVQVIVHDTNPKHFYNKAFWTCALSKQNSQPNNIYLAPSSLHRTIIRRAKVRAAGVEIIWDPSSHSALICHSLCPRGWRGAEEQDNYDIIAGWLSFSSSCWDTEGRNGQPERDSSHRKAIHHIERLCSVFIKGGCLWRWTVLLGVGGVRVWAASSIQVISFKPLGPLLR